MHKYTPPAWANKYTKESLPHRLPRMHSPSENFWYMELGGMHDSIADTEELRDELLKVALGIWDYVKNSGDYEAEARILSELEDMPEVNSTMGLSGIEAMDGYKLTQALTPRELSELMGLDYEVVAYRSSSYPMASSRMNSPVR